MPMNMAAKKPGSVSSGNPLIVSPPAHRGPLPMQPLRSSLTLSLTLGALTLAGCGGDSTIALPEEDIRDYITDLAVSAGVDAVFQSRIAPATGPGPVIDVGGSGRMITGGSSIRTVSSAQAFNRIIIAIEGVYGYWEITLPTTVTAEELILTLAQSLPDPEFNIRFALASAAGVGNWGSELVQVL